MVALIIYLVTGVNLSHGIFRPSFEHVLQMVIYVCCVTVNEDEREPYRLLVYEILPYLNVDFRVFFAVRTRDNKKMVALKPAFATQTRGNFVAATTPRE